MGGDLLFAGEVPTEGRWSHRSLDAFREQGDPLADEAVDELSRQQSSERDVLARLRNTAATHAGPCRRLLESVRTVPSWVQPERMGPGRGLAFRNLITSGLALMCGSLVESFTAADGAKVLVRTGQLQRNAVRRLFETAQFTHDIAACGGPWPGNRAHCNMIRVRMIHAWVRRAMLQRPDWDPAWGHPVNQEDNAGTLMMFSLVFARSLRVMGVPLSDNELDAIHHMWQYSGYLLGVHEDLLTATRADEANLYRWISSRQMRPNADSRDLTRALLSSMAGRPPFFLPLEGLQALSRAMVGDALADGLGLPRPLSWRLLGGPLRASVRTQSRVGDLPLINTFAERAGRRLSELILRQTLGRSAVPFHGPNA